DFGLCVSFGTANGAITDFGQGCPGTAQMPPVCAGTNTAGGALSNNTGVNVYAYELTTATPLAVSGIEVFSASRNGGNVNVNAYLFASAGSGPAPSPLAQTTITIGGGAGFYQAMFAAPVNVAAGT